MALREVENDCGYWPMRKINVHVEVNGEKVVGISRPTGKVVGGGGGVIVVAVVVLVVVAAAAAAAAVPFVVELCHSRARQRLFTKIQT
ncbi:hypothetical protein ElyMa_004169200 [Elysia marginata]|uniref:Uncharacterized protein n=1 Tax=Elysia marginata TaxID=1093978 RepID=A0AAV4GKM8_9GAST|nr:hypothetical protein ElyMa_004169200 [Elysia marginata]